MSIHYIRLDEETKTLVLHDGQKIHQLDLSALFGGTELAAGSVGTKHLQEGAVTPSKLSVTAKKQVKQPTE